jgi:hypothetical protein
MDPTPSHTTDRERLKLVVDIWKHAVGVQMHFNDMGMKIRTLYFTILAAAMGLVGVVQEKVIVIQSPPITVDLALFVVTTVIPISMLFYFLDKHWYHRLLLGAVNHCIFIETKYKDVLPEIALGAAISKESPVVFTGAWRGFFWFLKEPRFRDKTLSRIHSDAKIEVLYKSVIWTLVPFLVVYAFFGGIKFGGYALASIAGAFIEAHLHL